MNDLARERLETDAYKRYALRLGIEIPRTPGWWWEDMDSFGGSLENWELVREEYEYLTEIGKAGASRLVKAEQRRLEEEHRRDIDWNRKNTQWKLTIAGVIIGWLLGIAGILIAIFKD